MIHPTSAKDDFKNKKNIDKMKAQLKEVSDLNANLAEQNSSQNEMIRSLQQQLDAAVKENQELRNKTFAGFVDRLGKRLKG